MTVKPGFMETKMTVEGLPLNPKLTAATPKQGQNAFIKLIKSKKISFMFCQFGD